MLIALLQVILVKDDLGCISPSVWSIDILQLGGGKGRGVSLISLEMTKLRLGRSLAFVSLRLSVQVQHSFGLLLYSLFTVWKMGRTSLQIFNRPTMYGAVQQNFINYFASFSRHAVACQTIWQTLDSFTNTVKVRLGTIGQYWSEKYALLVSILVQEVVTIYCCWSANVRNISDNS